VFDGLDPAQTVTCLGLYLQQSGQSIPRAVAEQRMFAKLNKAGFLTDLRPLLSAQAATTLTEQFAKDVFQQVFTNFIERIPGAPWVKTKQMKELFALY